MGASCHQGAFNASQAQFHEVSCRWATDASQGQLGGNFLQEADYASLPDLEVLAMLVSAPRVAVHAYAISIRWALRMDPGRCQRMAVGERAWLAVASRVVRTLVHRAPHVTVV